MGTFAFFLVWAVCGVLAYGITLAYFQGQYPRVRDKGDWYAGLVPGLAGPIGLFIAVLFSQGCKHGIKFIPEGPDRNAPWRTF